MHSATARRLLTIAVIVLFLGFSMNAFACLVPLYGVPNMEAGCPSGNEQPPRTFCDAFKAGVPAHSSYIYPFAMHLSVPLVALDSLGLSCSTEVLTRDLDSSADSRPQNIFFKTTILRI
ncbi:MAG TPA: hypothetical protein PLY42_06210 [Nitrospira sp.]|jgi:hypothetical protein|nr:hypothetical protein [Nitrospira sp.]HNE32935.1 hypothetical protein [Nitrospira sp.]HNI20358.1 hypothetical protein [Nitrospira sp.]HNK50900.1 hypothetical protein [Nitrospira sp.]HNM18438.1 hypothetical protein [Nitrospira sp.]